MSNLQKIVVLCVIAGIAVFAFFFNTDHINAPSSDIEASLPDAEEQLPPNPNDEEGVEPPLDPVIENPDPEKEKQIACTMDAKQCPDGSFVGRKGPNCQFAPCPTPEPKVITCTSDMKKVDACIEIYQPVCGLTEVQCIQAPCPPIEETFSSGCHACSQGNVTSYTEGACNAEASLPPLYVEDFEGESDPNVMKLDMHTWKWIETQYSDDSVVTPNDPEAFTITFTDENFNATTDCNSVGGAYETDENKITFGQMMSTLMYCENAQEGSFTKMLTETQSYLFTTKGELILELKYDSGTMIFR